MLGFSCFCGSKQSNIFIGFVYHLLGAYCIIVLDNAQIATLVIKNIWIHNTREVIVNRLFLSALFSVILLQSHTSEAKDVVLSATGKDCYIREDGYGAKEKPIIFKGQLWSVGPNGAMTGCKIEVSEPEFDRQFTFCALSGIDIQGAGRCAMRRLSNGFVTFELSDSDNVTCSYTCVLKNKK
jgi:hypothetical protein